MENYPSTIRFLIFLLCLSALFSASETALTAANRIRLKNQSEEGDKKATGALTLVSEYDKTLSALLISNNVVNILTASLTTVIFTKLLGTGGVGMATAVTTVFVIIFGEVLPKSYANSNADNLLKSVQGLLHFISVIFAPAIKLLEIIKITLTKNIRTDDTPSVTEDELISIIDEIEDEGVLEEDEADLVQHAIEFGDITAGEILTPRVDITAVEITDTKENVLKLFLDTNFSRMPVYDGSIDNIVGFISQKDFFSAILQNKNFSFKTMVKPCLYVPPKRKIDDIMHDLQSSKIHMAVVTDEYGGTLGILTLEDVLEELVGDIWDEHDEETRLISRINDNLYEVSGAVPMEDLYEELLERDMEETDDYITLSGYLMDSLNKIPEKDECYCDDYLKYTVKKVHENRVQTVMVEIIAENKTEE